MELLLIFQFSTEFLSLKKKIKESLTIFQVESHDFKPFREAAVEYAARHLHRRPNNSLGCLEATRLRPGTDFQPREILQVGKPYNLRGHEARLDADFQPREILQVGKP